jgi:flagella synthesis protein FlgN
MQAAAPERDAFVSGLRAELSGFRELQRILRAEQDCLLRADAEGLLCLTETKSRQIELLDALARLRAGYLHALSLTPDRRGMAQWLAAHAGAEKTQLAALWEQLVDAATAARALNDSNGGLIGVRLNHNQDALAALQSAARSLSTYGPDGQAHLPAGQRELGRA